MQRNINSRLSQFFVRDIVNVNKHRDLNRAPTGTPVVSPKISRLKIAHSRDNPLFCSSNGKYLTDNKWELGEVLNSTIFN